MASKKSKCCVSVCDKLVFSVHRFPVYYEDVYKVWLERVGNTKLLDMDPIKVQKNYVVCDKHFSEETKIPNSKKLKLYSLPTLYLPGSSGNQCTWSSFQFPDTTETSCSSANEFRTRSLQDECISVTESPSEIPAHENQTCKQDVLATPCKKRRRTNMSSTGGKKRKNLLREINIGNKNELTPRKSLLYSATVQLRAQKNRLSRRCLSYKQRIDAAETFAESEFFKTLMESLDTVSYRFVMCQLRNKKFKPRGRRFTTEDKIMALALYKQSGKGYRLLSKIFALPSRKTMMSLLTKIPFNTGINDRIFLNLKKTTKNLSQREKKCVLIFDEMSLTANLQYDQKNDEVVGFEDVGFKDRKPEFADHALVFMVRGICKKFKQPVAYYFTRGKTKSVELVRILKQVIRAVQSTGLNIMATVCDQLQTNCAAINYLKRETQATYRRVDDEYKGVGFKIDGHEIIHLFDSPHLLKGVRNNLLTKNVAFHQNGMKKTAKWDHIKELYDLDKQAVDTDFRLLPKLSDYHVDEKKIKKMKVSFAAQVMSQRVASTMKRLSEFSGGSTTRLIDPEATETADFLLFMDKLFDSVNGCSVVPKQGKFLRCAITKKSKHVEFWNEALLVLESVRFVCPKTNKLVTVPSVRNWIENLKCFKVLCEKLFNTGVKFINMRAFNQDPLENYFGQIRSHGFRNTNPTASSFKNSFKALLLNNFVSSHSVGANCEEDETDGALNNLQSFILENVPQNEERIDDGIEERNDMQYDVSESENLPSDATRYVAGYVAKKILKNNNCSTCRDDICTSRDATSIIAAREYKLNSLHHPSANFVNVVNDVKNMFHKNISKMCHKRDLLKVFTMLSTGNIKDKFKCQIHGKLEETIKFVIRFLLFTETNTINKILNGKLSNINCSGLVKVNALKYYKKKESFRKKFSK